MMNILIAGSGRIGSLLSQLLANADNYHVLLIDENDKAFSHFQKSKKLQTQKVDVGDKNQLQKVIDDFKIDAVVACLPYFCNIKLAEMASELNLHYFDLTEDIQTVEKVAELAKGSRKAFVSRCGAAPGFINIVANSLMKTFLQLDTVKLRAGCLPKHISNSLQYAIAWSIDGLINEYGETCHGIVEGESVDLRPLDDIEIIELDGVVYEAFNTSGGLGALRQLYEGKVKTLNYKTMRYPGHCEKMHFLMQDLQLNEHRDTLKEVLLRALPHTDKDVMIIYVSVSGHKNDEFMEENYVLKIEPKDLFGQKWSAIQIATATSAAAVIDIVLSQPGKYTGMVLQEDFSLDEVLTNRFGEHLC